MTKGRLAFELLHSFTELAEKHPDTALVLATAFFIGMVEKSIKDKGDDPLREILIKSGEGLRGITVHAVDDGK